MRILMFLSFLSLAALLSCKAMTGRGELKDFNKGRALNDDAKYLENLKKTHPKVVIIYIGNNSYNATYANSRPNFDYIMKSLRDEAQIHRHMADNARDPKDKKMYQDVADKINKYTFRLLNEDSQFLNSITADIKALEEFACSNKGRARDDAKIGGLAVFKNNTNESIWGAENRNEAHRSQLRWEVCKHEQPYDDVNLLNNRLMKNMVYKPEFPYNVQPFSNPENIRRAIEAVRYEFETNSDEKFRYILIVKSHGDREKVVVPMISRDLIAEGVTHKEIVNAVIEVDKKQQVSNLSSTKLDNPILSSTKLDNPILSSTKLDNPILSTTSLPLITQLDKALNTKAKKTNVLKDIGYRKIDFLADMRKMGMEFPLTIWYSCQSALEYVMGTGGEQPWILQQAITKSKGNKTKMRSDGSIETMHIESYNQYSIRNAGLLYTSDLKGVKYNEIDFSRLINSNDKYFYIPDLQDAIQVLMEDTQKEGP